MRVRLHFWELDPEGYHLTLRARLAGYPVWLLVDTGANHSCFDRAYFESLGLEVGAIVGQDEVNVGIGGSDFETVIAQTDQLKIGRLRIPSMEARLLDLGSVNAMYETVGFHAIQGILGSDFLYRHRAVIDFAARELTLQSARKINHKQ